MMHKIIPAALMSLVMGWVSSPSIASLATMTDEEFERALSNFKQQTGFVESEGDFEILQAALAQIEAVEESEVEPEQKTESVKQKMKRKRRPKKKRAAAPQLPLKKNENVDKAEEPKNFPQKKFAHEIQTAQAGPGYLNLIFEIERADLIDTINIHVKYNVFGIQNKAIFKNHRREMLSEPFNHSCAGNTFIEVKEESLELDGCFLTSTGFIKRENMIEYHALDSLKATLCLKRKNGPQFYIKSKLSEEIFIEAYSDVSFAAKYKKGKWTLVNDLL